MSKDAWKKVCKVGPGGWKNRCGCCGPETGDKKTSRRVARSRLRLEDRAFVDEALDQEVARDCEETERDEDHG